MKKHNKKTLVVFCLILALLPMLFFVAIEYALRLANYGTDYRLFYKPKDGTPGMLYLNPDRSYKYFGDLKGSVFFNGIGFKEHKEPNTFRFFVLGGSSAQGFPYAQSASFPSHLKRRLALLHPDQPVEVVNLGASAINSHTLLDILPEVLEQSPDLLLVYAGHNEYYGALGPASSRSFGAHPAMVRGLLWLRDLRGFQVMDQLIAYFSQPSYGPSANLMEDMIGESFVDKGSSTYHLGIDQYHYNMSRILEKIRDAGVPVIMGTLASNLKDQKPFHADQLDERGKSAQKHFELANQLFAEEKYEQAHDHFIQAKEWDGLRFRAPEDINKVIRQMSVNFDVPLVEVDSYFDSLSTGHTVGNNLMCDHLHPNMRGYFELSKAFYAKISERGFLGTALDSRESNAVDSLLLATMPFSKLDSVQAQLTLVNLLGNYPYIPKGEPNSLLANIRKVDFVDEIGAVQNVDSARVVIAGEYLNQGDSAKFVKELDVMTSYFPAEERPYLSLMKYLQQQGDFNKAGHRMIEQLEGQPASNSQAKMLGLLYANVQNYQAAIIHLSKAIEERPVGQALLSRRGMCYLMEENYQKAVMDYDAVLRINPGDVEAHHQRGVARFELKDYRGTVEDFDAIIASDGSAQPLSYFIRGYAYYGMGNKESACADWQIAAQGGHADAKQLEMKFCN